MTLVTALSEVGGLNPVSQAALTYLKPGDVVQLEIVQVSLLLIFCFSDFLLYNSQNLC